MAAANDASAAAAAAATAQRDADVMATAEVTANMEADAAARLLWEETRRLIAEKGAEATATTRELQKQASTATRESEVAFQRFDSDLAAASEIPTGAASTDDKAAMAKWAAAERDEAEGREKLELEREKLAAAGKEVAERAGQAFEASEAARAEAAQAEVLRANGVLPAAAAASADVPSAAASPAAGA